MTQSWNNWDNGYDDNDDDSCRFNMYSKHPVGAYSCHTIACAFYGIFFLIFIISCNEAYFNDCEKADYGFNGETRGV